MSKAKRKSAAKKPEALFERVVSILEQARGNVVRAVNTNMVLAYWLIGRELVEGVQGGAARAEYGEKIVEELSARLTERYGKGFSVTNLWYFKQFYLAFQDRIQIPRPAGGESSDLTIPYPVGGESLSPAIPTMTGMELAAPTKSHPAGSQSLQGFSPQLSWSHYRALMRVDNPDARDFYEREAVAGAWDKRTLERQIQSFYYERMLKSRKPEKMLAEGRQLPVAARFTRRCVEERDGGPLFGAERSEANLRLQIHAFPANGGTIATGNREGAAAFGSQTRGGRR